MLYLANHSKIVLANDLEPRGSARGLSQVLFGGNEAVFGRWQASLVLLYHDKRGTCGMGVQVESDGSSVVFNSIAYICM